MNSGKNVAVGRTDGGSIRGPRGPKNAVFSRWLGYRGLGDRKALVKLKSSSALVIELHFLKQVKKSK